VVRKNYKTEDMLIDDLHEGVRELGELTADTSTRLGDKAVSAIRRLEKAIPNVRTRLTGWKDSIGTHARDAGEQIDEFVREKPWSAVGWAAGIGLFIGILLSGGGDSRKD
jgi:ElaB/YqjD/DUF883 family membrane-anchored ribosome-binding protein